MRQGRAAVGIAGASQNLRRTQGFNGGKMRNDARSRRIRRRLSLSQGLLPLGRITADLEEGNPGGGLVIRVPVLRDHAVPDAEHLEAEGFVVLVGLGRGPALAVV